MPRPPPPPPIINICGSFGVPQNCAVAMLIPEKNIVIITINVFVFKPKMKLAGIFLFMT
jgi:hypothetical protein